MKKWFYRIMLVISVIFAAIGMHLQAMLIGFSGILFLLLYYIKKPSVI